MSQKILILDDDTDLLSVLSMLLEDSGYEIMALSSGKAIFETIRLFNPDLVLMDVMLAEMDGRVICRDIKERNETKNLPVILISGSHDLAQTLHQRGAPNDFLAKPFDIHFLLNKVEGFLAA